VGKTMVEVNFTRSDLNDGLMIDVFYNGTWYRDIMAHEMESATYLENPQLFSLGFYHLERKYPELQGLQKVVVPEGSYVLNGNMTAISQMQKDNYELNASRDKNEQGSTIAATLLTVAATGFAYFYFWDHLKWVLLAIFVLGLLISCITMKNKRNILGFTLVYPFGFAGLALTFPLLIVSFGGMFALGSLMSGSKLGGLKTALHLFSRK
jgi:hypothetical protein